MNRGLMHKAAIEVAMPTLMLGLMLMLVEGLLAYLLPTFQEQFSSGVMQLKFMQNIVGAMLGVDLSGPTGPEVFQAFPWVHPIVLTIVWAHALTICSRMPAGEIDRGTADLTLTLPVTRWEILRSETAVAIAAAVVLLAFGLAGNAWASYYVPRDQAPAIQWSVVAALNLLALYLSVAGLAWLTSAASNRRGLAVSVALAVLLSSYLLNFLAQFWEPARRVAFLGLLDYYRPLYVLRDHAVPWQNLATLIGVGAVCWTIAGVTFSRRDVATT